MLRQKLTESNLRKWRVRYDRCQRRVADKVCRFLIVNMLVRCWRRFVWPIPFIMVTRVALTPKSVTKRGT
jgi:hypothetical protein